MSAETAPLGVERHPDVIVLTGEIDAHTVALVRDALVPVPETGDLYLDLSGVTFLDSSGLRVVLEVHQMLERDGRRLVLMCPSTPVARLIEVAGLASHLHVEPPLDSIGSTQFNVGVDR